MSGREERDVLFARLFGTMSVIQSGLAVRTRPLPTSASSATLASTLESYDHIIIQLIGLGDQKSWLRESAWFAISLAISALYESEVSWKEDAVEKTLQHLFVENKIWSTEKIALALKLQDLYPGRNWKTLLSPTFRMSDLLSTGNLMIIARILKVCLPITTSLPPFSLCSSRNQQQTRMVLKFILRHQAGRGNHS